MPTYTVSAAAGRLAPEQKARIAFEITRVHSQATGAQGFFAQVMFVEIDGGNHFVGGAPLAADHVFVHGQIRAGRSPEVKRALLEQLVAAVAAAVPFERSDVWAYLVELPPSQMAEYGHVLPEPGQEAAWLAALPPADRERMLRAAG